MQYVVLNVTICLFAQMGQFYYAAKAFDVLERLDPNPEYWEGKRGACVGIFQQIIAGHVPRLDSSHQRTHAPWGYSHKLRLGVGREGF